MASTSRRRPRRPNGRRADAALADPVRWRILAVILTALFMSLVGVSIVNVALPSIQKSLSASQSDIQWVLSGYALTFGVILVAAGRAGDLMGRGGYFLIGVVVFTVASVAAGLAPSAQWLNAARFIQGLGSGLLAPQSIGMIQQYFRGTERGRAFGYLGTMVGLSVAVGPPLGGVLIELGGADLGWRLTFLVNVPVGVLTLVLGLIWFPRPLVQKPPREGRDDTRLSLTHTLDPVGSLLLGLAVLAVLFPFVEARAAPAIWLLIPASAVLVWVWVKWEQGYARKGYNPMVNLDVFATRSFSNGALIMTLYFLGMTSVWVLVALFVQDGAGKSAFESGLFGVPAALLSAMASDWAGRRVARYGRHIVIVGIVLALAGLALSAVVALLSERGLISVWWLLLSLSLIGLAQGAVISPNQTLTLTDVPLDYAGSSGAIMQTGQRIGTSVGIAVITATVFIALDVTDSWATAVTVGFTTIAAVVCISLAFAFKDLHDRNRSTPKP